MVHMASSMLMPTIDYDVIVFKSCSPHCSWQRLEGMELYRVEKLF